MFGLSAKVAGASDDECLDEKHMWSCISRGNHKKYGMIVCQRVTCSVFGNQVIKQHGKWQDGKWVL